MYHRIRKCLDWIFQVYGHIFLTHLGQNMSLSDFTRERPGPCSFIIEKDVGPLESILPKFLWYFFATLDVGNSLIAWMRRKTGETSPKTCLHTMRQSPPGNLMRSVLLNLLERKQIWNLLSNAGWYRRFYQEKLKTMEW